MPPVLLVAEAPAPPPASWLRRWLINPLLDQLKAGLAPGKLALTVGLGVAFGLTPTFGITTLVSSATALRLRLNMAVMQLAAHLMSAFQLALLIPFLRAGATLMGQGERVANLTVKSLRHMIDHEGWGAVGQLLWRAEVGALLIWAAASVPLVALIYFILRPVFQRIIAKQNAALNEE